MLHAGWKRMCGLGAVLLIVFAVAATLFLLSKRHAPLSDDQLRRAMDAHSMEAVEIIFGRPADVILSVEEAQRTLISVGLDLDTGSRIHGWTSMQKESDHEFSLKKTNYLIQIPESGKFIWREEMRQIREPPSLLDKLISWFVR